MKKNGSVHRGYAMCNTSASGMCGNAATSAGTSPRDVEERSSMNEEECIRFWRICNMHHVRKWCALETLPCLQALAVGMLKRAEA